MKYYTCVFGFVSHNDKLYHYNDIINEDEYDTLTSSEKRNFKLSTEKRTKLLNKCLC